MKNMKKYFTFKTLRKKWKGALIILVVMAFGTGYDGHASLSLIIKLELIAIVLFILETLIIDWVQMRKNRSEDE